MQIHGDITAHLVIHKKGVKMKKIEYGYIATYHGKPVFCFPPNWIIGADWGALGAETCYSECLAKQKYGEEIIIYTTFDVYSDLLQVLITKVDEPKPVYECVIELNSHSAPSHEAFDWIVDQWKKEEFELLRPKKPPLGKLRPVPTCPKCGGTVDLETFFHN